MDILAGVITTVFGIYLTSLFAIAFVKKKSVVNYLSSFASSAKAHYSEQIIRLTAGIGLVVYSSEMIFSELFKIFGWTLIITSLVLLTIPWKWHHKFGQWAIPFVIKNLRLYTLIASLLGIIILYCTIMPII